MTNEIANNTANATNRHVASVRPNKVLALSETTSMSATLIVYSAPQHKSTAQTKQTKSQKAATVADGQQQHVCLC